MTQTTITPEMIQETISFHGHSCPGLALGIRAAEVALEHMGRASDEDVVAVVETDMCGVDAIQYLTGCTFGKGNLIHLDYGKNAFSFFRRSDGKAIRVVARPELFENADRELAELRNKMASEGLTPEEQARVERSKKHRIERIMRADPGELFEIQQPSGPAPRKARILNSLVCDACGEKAMESRTRRFMGKNLCLPCFETAENRL
jgi:formylmethanofuran dehydrogenase subunit E